MSSQKQIDANRLNAKKSTGPRTATGKAKSRLNALRDGLTGQITTLSPEDRAIFDQLRAEMLADFNPKTALERKLANAIAWDTWRLDRLRAIETNLYALGMEEDLEDDAPTSDDFDAALSDARTFRSEAPRLDLMSLYEQRMTRNIHRNVALLRNLQAERKQIFEHDKNEEILIGRLCEFNRIPIKASTAPSPNGFIFSDEEIATATVRQRYVDTANYVLKGTKREHLYGTLPHGVGDSFFDKPFPRPEELAIERLNHPEDFDIPTQ